MKHDLAKTMRSPTTQRNASRRVTLDRILDRPDLVQAVQSLAPALLSRLIRHVGLEDCGELVALATTEQLERVFDEELWTSDTPGRDESFDPARFALWLAVLVEQSVPLAARKLAALDEDLITLALSRHLLVIDVEQLARRMSRSGAEDELDLLEKQLDSALYLELEQYRVIARDARTFEAIAAVLIELNEQDFATLSRLLERCCDLSSESIEDNGGLYEVLTAEQTIELDVAAEREARREQSGYVAPSAALAFLRLAAQTTREEILAACTDDLLTRAHFRGSRKPTSSEPAHVPQGERALAPGASAAPLHVLLEELHAAELSPEAGALRALPRERGHEDEPLLARALHLVAEEDARLHEVRMQELAYVANVLLAGCGVRSHRLRAVEAAELAVATCDLGAELLHEAEARPSLRHARGLAARLGEVDLVKLFRLGFRSLCESTPPPAVARRPALTRLRKLLVRQKLCAPLAR